MENIQTHYPYGFSIVSDPEAIDFSDVPANFFTKANLHDSIAIFFPYGECQFDDTVGAISEGVLYSESMKFKIKLFENKNKNSNSVDNNANELVGDFLWSGYEIPVVPFNSGKITGTSLFQYISYYRFLDIIGSSSYNDTPDAVAKKVANDIYSISPENQKISQSGTKSDFWYRVNELYSSFLKNSVAPYAYNQSSKYPETPFFTFINLKNEFYFMSLSDIFDQKPVATLYPYTIAEQQIDNNVILTYRPIFTGFNVNGNSYSLSQYIFTDNFEKNDFQLVDALVKPSSRGNFLFDRQKLSNNPYNVQYFGLVSETDGDSYRGEANYFFLNSVLSYRLDIQTVFNSNLVAGHIVEVEFNSVLSSNLSPEYSGLYLVLESHHGMGNDGQAFTNCLLAKPVVDLRSDHKFKNRYM